MTQTGPEELQSERLEAVCDWEDDLPADAIPGAVLFATSGCLSCHTYRGVGSRNLGARDLTRVGRRHSRRFFERFVRNPATFGDNVMPPFRFRRRQMRQLSLFLAASKGAS